MTTLNEIQWDTDNRTATPARATKTAPSAGIRWDDEPAKPSASITWDTPEASAEDRGDFTQHEPAPTLQPAGTPVRMDAEELTNRINGHLADHEQVIGRQLIPAERAQISRQLIEQYRANPNDDLATANERFVRNNTAPQNVDAMLSRSGISPLRQPTTQTAQPAQPQPDRPGLLGRAGAQVWDQGARIAADTATLPQTLTQNVIGQALPGPLPAQPPVGFKIANAIFGEGQDANAAYTELQQQVENERASGNPLSVALPQVRPQPATEARTAIHETLGPTAQRLPPAQNPAEKYLVDLPANLIGTGAEIAIDRRLLPQSLPRTGAAGEAAAWELQNQAAGGIPGRGAIMGATVGAVNKAFPNAPVKATVAEGLAFGTSTYLETGDVQESLVNALLPAVMRTPQMVGWARGRLESRNTPQERQQAMNEIRQRVESLSPQNVPANAPEPGAVMRAENDAVTQGKLARATQGVGSIQWDNEPKTTPTESAPPTTPPVETAPTTPPPKPPRKFFKRDIERELLDRYESVNGDARDAAESEIGKQGIGPFTFYGKKFPEEVETFLQGHPDRDQLRSQVFKLTDRHELAGGEDAMHNLGDRYFQLAEQTAGKGIEQSVADAEKSQDPRAQLLAAIWRNLPPTKERIPYKTTDPSSLATGAKFSIQGHEFSIVEDADGFRVMRDGDDYPVLPVDQVGKVPIDKNSIKAPTEPEVPPGDFAPETMTTVASPALPADNVPNVQEGPTRSGDQPQPQAVEGDGVDEGASPQGGVGTGEREQGQAEQPNTAPARNVAEGSLTDLRALARIYGIDPEQPRTALVEQLRAIEHQARKEGSLKPGESLLDDLRGDVGNPPQPVEVKPVPHQPIQPTVTAAGDVIQAKEGVSAPAKKPAIESPWEIFQRQVKAADTQRLNDWLEKNPTDRRADFVRDELNRRQPTEQTQGETRQQRIEKAKAEGRTNPRYLAYLQTTDEPSNAGFMGFIGRMTSAFNKSIGKPADASIIDHDSFSRFIQERSTDTQSKLSTGTLPAGGRTGLFGQPDFEAKPGKTEQFGFAQDDAAAKREQQRVDQRARDAIASDKAQAAESESARDKETGHLFTEPPKSGLFNVIEDWATKRLAEKQADNARIAQEQENLPPKMRRRKGDAGPLDPETILLKTVQLAARMAKGGVDRALWVKELVREFGDDIRKHVGVIWMNARALKSMDEPARAEWIQKRAAPERLQSENPATLARDIAKLRNTDQLAEQLKQLRTRALAARAGSEQARGIAKELARVAQENLPDTLTGRLLNRVAAAGSVKDMARSIARVNEILAQHNVDTALSDVENLVGKGELKIYRQPGAHRPGQPQGQHIPGNIDPASLKTVKLEDLSLATRDQIRPLIEQARLLKSQLARTTMPTKTADRAAFVQGQIDSTARLRDIERQIRVLAANDLSQREVRIAGKLQTLDDIKRQAVTTINAPKAEPTGEHPKEASKLRAAWRWQYNPEALLSTIFGETHPAHQLSIAEIRRGQEEVYRLQQQFQKGLQAKLKSAGIPSHTAAYDRWLSNRETLDLPDAGKVKLTRPEMLDLYGHSGDAQTAQDIARGVEWNFESNRRGEPLKLTEADVNTIIANLKPEERTLVDYFKQFRDRLFPQAVAAKLSLEQSAPDKIEGNYPRARNRISEELPTSWQAVQKKRLENVTTMKDRGQDKVTPFLIRNSIEVMHDDIFDTANLIHMAERLHNVAAVLESREAQGALEQKIGPSVNRQIRQFLLDTAHDSGRVPRTIVEKAWATIARNVSRSALALNLSPMAKNALAGTVALAPEFDPIDLQQGIAHPASFQHLIDASPVAWNRYEGGGLYGQYSPLLERRVLPEARLSVREAVKRKKFGAAIDAIPLMQRADAVPFRIAFAAAQHFIERTRPGLTGDAKTEAILQKFHEAVYRTQNGNSSTEISFAASRARQIGPIHQALLMFMSDANKKLNQFARWNQMKPQQRARLVASTAIGSLISAAVGYTLKRTASNVGQAITGAVPNREQADRDVHNFVWDTVSNVTGMSYAGNYLTDMVRSLVSRGEADLTNPASSTFQRTVTGIGRVVIALAKDLDAPAGSRRLERTRESLLKALVSAQEPSREAIGDPTVPISRLAMRGYRTGTYEPKPDKYSSPDVRAEMKHLIDAGRPEDARRMMDRNNIGLPSTQRMIASGKLEDAVKLFGILSPEERRGPGLPDTTAAGKGKSRSLVDQLRDRIVNSDLTPDRQDELLKQTGIEAPLDLTLPRELKALYQKSIRAKTGGPALTDDEEDRLHELRQWLAKRTKIRNSEDSPTLKQQMLDELNEDYRREPVTPR